MMLVFYHAVIESVLRYGMSAWFGNITVKMKAELDRLGLVGDESEQWTRPVSPDPIKIQQSIALQ